MASISQPPGSSQKMRYKDCKRQFGEEQTEIPASGHKRTTIILKSHQLFLAQDQGSQCSSLDMEGLMNSCS